MTAIILQFPKASCRFLDIKGTTTWTKLGIWLKPIQFNDAPTLTCSDDADLIIPSGTINRSSAEVLKFQRPRPKPPRPLPGYYQHWCEDMELNESSFKGMWIQLKKDSKCSWCGK